MIENSPCNQSVGYTDDGKIFMKLNTVVNKVPAEVWVTWDPVIAREVAGTILKAIDQMAEATKLRVIQ